MSKKGGHHGGAWKVAYADFVTAMMALFLVLWLAAQDQKIKESVERAFRNPFMSLTKESSGLMPTKNDEAGKSKNGITDLVPTAAVEAAMLKRLHESLAKSLSEEKADPDEESVRLDLTSEGLRINIFDRGRKPVFEPDSDKLTEYGTWILTTLAWGIGRYPTFLLEVEGHTERGHTFARPVYGGWELSSDRANAGRRKLVEHGVKTQQIRKVAGYADSAPWLDHPPEDLMNNRISILLRVQNNKPNR